MLFAQAAELGSLTIELVKQAPYMCIVVFLVIKFLDHQTKTNAPLIKALNRNTKTMHGLAVLIHSFVGGQQHLQSVIDDLGDDDEDEDEEETEDQRKVRR